MCLDIDDTLLDNEASSRQALRALVGNDGAWPVWRRTTEEHYARFVEGEIDFDVMCTERTRAFFAAFGEHLSDTEAARREDVRMAAMQRAWGLFDDARPCLDWLRAAGLRLAVITNAPSDYQRKKIAAIGLADAFDAVVISGEVGVAKPDAGIFAAACARLGLEPHEVAHVGDRLDTDAVGARDAGLRGIWLNRAGKRRPAPEGVHVITSLRQLPELLVCDLEPAGA
ncbi:HAD family hydrolase [Saccharopolyspora taberi]|uniref:HAD family hydrolase n=1 Tax=Saccharopolyspora taberi TaxID=60895 RepID=A0ABN3V5R1_9PSEU